MLEKAVLRSAEESLIQFRALLAKDNFYHKQSMLVYGGNKTEPLNEHTSIISWKDIGDI